MRISFDGPLPEDRFIPDHDTAESWSAELQRALPTGLLLLGQDVEFVVWRDGVTDDRLFRHVASPERFTVIHLSWSHRTEIDAQHPQVEFDGTYDSFIAEELRRYGAPTPSEPAGTSSLP